MESLKEWVWEMRKRKSQTISRRRDLTLQGKDIENPDFSEISGHITKDDSVSE